MIRKFLISLLIAATAHTIFYIRLVRKMEKKKNEMKAKGTS